MPWVRKFLREVRLLAILLLPLALAACFGSDDGGSTSFLQDSSTPQPYPTDYRAELVAFMHTYLDNPVGVRDAVMADPVERTVAGNLRYVSCLRFSAQQSDGIYRAPRQYAVVFVNGRLDRELNHADDICTGVNYAPFPELEQMGR